MLTQINIILLLFLFVHDVRYIISKVNVMQKITQIDQSVRECCDLLNLRDNESNVLLNYCFVIVYELKLSIIINENSIGTLHIVGNISNTK
jgi:hypothetical protein